MPFIILHKVRGEPVFDIAEPFCKGKPPCQPNCGLWRTDYCIAKDEDWWLVQTSGHRAYPAQFWEIPTEVLSSVEALPDDLEDHYHADIDRSATRAPSGEGAALLKELGLCEPSKQLSLNLPSTGITLKPSPK